MIYAISDIHGCIKELQKQMEQVDLDGDNRIVFLGDYIDRGDSSFQVLQFIRDLQKKYGDKKVIVLKGNHEQMFLEWIDNYRNICTDDSKEHMIFNDWLVTDFKSGANTINTFISKQQMDFLNQISTTASIEKISSEAVKMILSNHEKLILWIKNMPLYYETENQIFVHAGVDEEAEDYWMWGTTENIFLSKFPATKGKFYKTIISGHIGTCSKGLANDRGYHDVYFDGESHYYIDGSVYSGGKLILLAYDENQDKYYQIENGRKIEIKKFHKYY